MEKNKKKERVSESESEKERASTDAAHKIHIYLVSHSNWRH